jgi:AAA domain
MQNENNFRSLHTRLAEKYRPVPDAKPEALLGSELQIDAERRAPKDGPPPPPKARFVFETMDDIFKGEDEKYLIDGWIPETGVGLFYAKWGNFKTFIAFDWALHLAYGMKDWHGIALPGEPCHVLIIAREGRSGFRRRVDAFMKHHGLNDKTRHITFMRCPISFLDDRGFEELKAEIERLGLPFKLVVVDTVGRALPGADMAKEQPITMFMERLQQLGEITGGVSIGVHHENKSGDVNGSMYFQNNSDFMLQSSRDGKTLSGKITCAKQKDGNDGWSRDFTMVKVDLGDGKSSLVVESVTDSEGKSSSDISPRQARALDALDEVVLSHGEPPPLDIKGVRAVAIDCWRDELFARGILDRDAKNPRTDFKRLKDQLANRFFIAERNGLVWRAK